MRNSKRAIFPMDTNTATGAYSPGVGVGDFVFVSGQGPIDFTTREFQLGTIESETLLTLENVGRVLAAAGASLDDVVKVTDHLRNIDDFSRFNSVYSKFFPHPYPARTTVQSVLASGISIEIDAIAICGCGTKQAVASTRDQV